LNFSQAGIQFTKSEKKTFALSVSSQIEFADSVESARGRLRLHFNGVNIMFFKNDLLYKPRKVVAAVLLLSATFSPMPAANALQNDGTLTTRLPNGYFQTINGAAPVKKLPTFDGAGSGSLLALDSTGSEMGSCALKHTAVSVHVSGYLASVDVTQKFHNPFNKKIEAQYTFPLSESGAVDDMTMRIGERTIRGTVKKKGEAQRIYKVAKAQGKVASLLDQEKPNIFTQYVANIEPGKDIEVNIHYVDVLPFESGHYTFAFPTVVGPRFTPPGAQVAISKLNLNNFRIPEQMFAGESTSALNPTYSSASGHDLSMSIDIDAGVPVQQVFCPLHAISVTPSSSSHAQIELKNQHSRPNRDFVLSWKVSDDSIKGGYFTERTGGKSGYLSLMLLPPARVTSQTAAPKEMIFVVDKSGSQSGAPLEKAKETLAYIVQHMNPNDTFQIISFSSGSENLFEKPMKADEHMKSVALDYIRNLKANGGTFMADAVEAVCATPAEENRLRIVTFMTDGYIGDDMKVLSLVKESRGRSRWFPFGTGDSVNRFLIERMAQVGGGEPDFVLLNKPGEEVAKKFYDQISSPVLTDVRVSFEGIEVEDVMPRNLQDVWAEKPLYIQARYTKPGHGIVKLQGFSGGKPYTQSVQVTLPERTSEHNGLAQVWARKAVDELMALEYRGVESGGLDTKLKSLIEELGVRYHIMTQFTSFVAVDESLRTAGGDPITVEVPAEVPEGIKLQDVFAGRSYSMPETQDSAPQFQTTEVHYPPGERSRSLNPSSSSSSSSSSSFNFGFGDPFSYMTRDANLFDAPILQGATNGTLGPQGSDASSIMGVNTAGTVRIQNLADGSGIISYLLNLGLMLGGVIAIVFGITKLASRKPKAWQTIALGATWLAVWKLLPIALVPWSLWILAGWVSHLLAQKFAWARAKSLGQPDQGAQNVPPEVK
jgi:Ca-activated chloride channel family protein